MSQDAREPGARALPGQNLATDTHSRFQGLLDVVLPVTVILGTATISVRRCLSLQHDSVLKLDQSAGADLAVEVNGIRIARGEVVIVDDSIAVRLTSLARVGKESAA